MPFKDLIKRKKYEKERRQKKEYQEYCKKWRLDNKEYFIDWANDNREKIREAVNKYRKTPKGKLNNRMRSSNHRALTKDLTVQTIQRVYEDNIKRYGTLTCYLCLEPIKFGEDHLEHKTPISRGGNSQYNNLDIACRKCNQSKSSKTEVEYREEIIWQKTSWK